jgi:two-component system sensor histidine kinase KdpD
VLAVARAAVPSIEQRDLLEAMAAQLATFVQKDRAMQSVREAQVAARSQKLQKALFDSVSHELKTPLAAVSGLLDQAKPDTGEIRQAVQRLTRTVNHLLDATRLESGLLRPSLEWVESVELAREAVDAAVLGGHEVRVTHDNDVPALRVDGGLIAQAVAMLVSNAATHSPRGAPVELHVAQDAGGVIFSVLDRGPGLPAGEEEKIFDKFHRGRGAAPGGLGLGLSIARQLADLHSGTITARNRPGGGALFALRLPAGERMRLPEEQLA